MHSWANFCYIDKFNLKAKNLVAFLAARFFLNEDDCLTISDIEFLIVPPEIDRPRSILISNIEVDPSNNSIVLWPKNNNEELEWMVGKNLLIDLTKYKNLFKNKSAFDTKSIIGMKVVDSKLGEIGKVLDVGGTSAQSLLIVEHGENECMIPWVDNIVLEVQENKILVDLPKGLLEINE